MMGCDISPTVILLKLRWTKVEAKGITLGDFFGYKRNVLLGEILIYLSIEIFLF